MDHPVRHMDHVMWNMEMPTSPVTVTGMMFMKGAVDHSELKRQVRNRLLGYPRFRQCIIEKNGVPHWHDDEHFDIQAHVHHVALPAPAGYKELQELVSDLMGMPLDPQMPLWQVHLVDGYQGGSVVIWRIHHTVADGTALIRVVFSLTSNSAMGSLKLTGQHKKTQSSGNDHGTRTGRLLQRAAVVRSQGISAALELQRLLHNPEQLRELWGQGLETVRDLAGLIAEEPPAGTMYKGTLSMAKRVAWSEPVSLQDIKDIGRSTGTTVNDVLLAMMTGAFRRHLTSHHEKLLHPFRVVCPVNVRSDGEIRLDNTIGMISLNLPVEIPDFLERLRAVHQRTKRLKRSMEPAVSYGLVNLLGDLLPKKLEQRAARFLGARIMGVLSNVPGPVEPIYFCGREMDNLMFWIPQTYALGLGISIISYNGKVSVGVASDARLVAEPDGILEGFYKEYREGCRLFLPEHSGSRG